MKLQAFFVFFNTFSALATPITGRRGGQNPPLRGDKTLMGYSSSNNHPGLKQNIEYTLLPGQKEDPDIGTYLDFENVKNPQPIRGPTGGPDPGPSMYRTLFAHTCVDFDFGLSS